MSPTVTTIAPAINMPNVHPSPVVSPNSQSPESILARSTKAIELQLAKDTKFDPPPPTEPFCNYSYRKQLLLLAISALFMVIVLVKTRKS
jgi:hypothetical protein